MMDHLQDVLNSFEDDNLTGHTTAVAWNSREKEESDLSTELQEKFDNPGISVPGVMGWLTGSQLKPIFGQRPVIMVLTIHAWKEIHATPYAFPRSVPVGKQ